NGKASASIQGRQAVLLRIPNQRIRLASKRATRQYRQTQGEREGTDREPSRFAARANASRRPDPLWLSSCVSGCCEPGRFAVRWGRSDAPDAQLGTGKPLPTLSLLLTYFVHFFVQRSELRDLYDKAAAGERFSEADALRLFESKDLNAVGAIAD